MAEVTSEAKLKVDVEGEDELRKLARNLKALELAAGRVGKQAGLAQSQLAAVTAASERRIDAHGRRVASRMEQVAYQVSYRAGSGLRSAVTASASGIGSLAAAFNPLLRVLPATTTGIAAFGAVLVGLGPMALRLTLAFKTLTKTFEWAQDAAKDALEDAARAYRAFPRLIGKPLQEAADETELRMDAIKGIIGKGAEDLQTEITRRWTTQRLEKGIRGDPNIFKRWGITPESRRAAERRQGRPLDISDWVERFIDQRERLDAAMAKAKPGTKQFEFLAEARKRLAEDTLKLFGKETSDAILNWSREQLKAHQDNIKKISEAFKVEVKTEDAINFEKAFAAWGVAWEKFTQAVGAMAMPGATKLLETLTQKFIELKQPLLDLAGGMAQSSWQALTDLVRELDAEKIKEWGEELRKWMNPEDIKKDVQALLALFQAIGGAIRAVQNDWALFKQELAQLKKDWEDFATLVTAGWDKVKTGFTTLGDMIFGWPAKLAEAFKSAFGWLWKLMGGEGAAAAPATPGPVAPTDDERKRGLQELRRQLEGSSGAIKQMSFGGDAFESANVRQASFGMSGGMADAKIMYALFPHANIGGINIVGGAGGGEGTGAAGFGSGFQTASFAPGGGVSSGGGFGGYGGGGGMSVGGASAYSGARAAGGVNAASYGNVGASPMVASMDRMSPSAAIDAAMKMEGLHEGRDRAAIKEYLRTGGVGMDPARKAWCAAFVNATLAKAGMPGTGSQVARSFMRYGTAVAPGDVQKGDILVEHKGRTSGLGGHVGFATGRIDPKTGRIEFIGGNTGDQVGRRWYNPSQVAIRRPNWGMAQPAPTATGPSGGVQLYPAGSKLQPRLGGFGSKEDPRGMEQHIRETAAKYGIDPDVAVRVAQSEGLRSFQSTAYKRGVREPSWGAFQLYTGGGLGNLYQKMTGRDPRDPANEKDTIEFALRYASKHGWGSWYGARNTGIANREGIGTYKGGGPITVPPAATKPGSDAPVLSSQMFAPGRMGGSGAFSGSAEGTAFGEAAANSFKKNIEGTNIPFGGVPPSSRGVIPNTGPKPTGGDTATDV